MAEHAQITNNSKSAPAAATVEKTSKEAPYLQMQEDTEVPSPDAPSVDSANLDLFPTSSFYFTPGQPSIFGSEFNFGSATSQIDWFAMSQPYLTRGISGRQQGDAEAIKLRWLDTFGLAQSLGFGWSQATWISNTLTPMAIDSALKGDFPTAFELSNQELNLSPTMVNAPAIHFKKLEVGEPDDPFEREADDVADRLMRSAQPFVQRKCAECEKEDEEKVQKKPQLQMKAGSGQVTTVQPWVQQQIEASRGGGQRLPDKTRNFMESGIGSSFENVNIHTDANAVKMNRELGARAFTVGNDIFFNSGQYSPTSGDGQQLLAHELAHTVQQTGIISPKVQRVCVNTPSTAPSSGMSGCSTETSRPAHPNAEVDFNSGMSSLDATDQASLATVAAKWHADARNDAVRIDGFSSCDGGTTSNWKLSCSRVNAVETELKAPTGGSPGIPATATFLKFAHGETEEFSTTTPEDNRKGQVTLQPVPSSVPATVPGAGSGDFKIKRVPSSSQSKIFFEGGKAILTADAKTQIDNLKASSPGAVRLIGFASMEEPTSLAQDRADAVKARLTSSPNAVTVSSAVGNAAATSTRSDFARARSVEILTGSATPTTLDCDAVVPGSSPPVKVNPPTAPCSTMDPATETDFQSALVVANNAMTAAMKAINPADSKHDPALITKFFGNTNPSTLTTLATNMGKLQTHVSGLPAITSCGGQCDTGGCESGSTIAYNNDVDAASTMTLCVPVFKGMHLNDQARNLIHESAHGTSPLGGPTNPTKGTKDLAYRHERMIFHLSPADRLRNSDSYALFALFAKETQDTGNPSATPAGISTPAQDSITGVRDKPALERALAELEKRLTWSSDHSNQMFGQAQDVKDGKITWAQSWAEDYMKKAATLFPVRAPSSPPAPPNKPNMDDMAKLAAIVERYKIMKFEVRRNLTITGIPAGIISWPKAANGFASDTLQVGPDFFNATPENQVSLLLENLARSTPDVEAAFIPAYVSFAEFIHSKAD